MNTKDAATTREFEQIREMHGAEADQVVMFTCTRCPQRISRKRGTRTGYINGVLVVMCNHCNAQLVTARVAKPKWFETSQSGRC